MAHWRLKKVPAHHGYRSYCGIAPVDRYPAGRVVAFTKRYDRWKSDAVACNAALATLIAAMWESNRRRDAMKPSKPSVPVSNDIASAQLLRKCKAAARTFA